MGIDRSLLMEHDALLLQQIARDLFHAISHRHDYKRTAFVKPVCQHWWEQANNMLVGLHLSATNGSSGTQAWTARFADGNANHCTVFPPLSCEWTYAVTNVSLHNQKSILGPYIQQEN